MLANMAQTSFANIESETVLDSTSMNEVVITGSRQATDSRHLPMTVNVIDRKTLTENERTNILPTVMEQVPALMLTSRGMLGYGVSTGAAGGMTMRGVSSGAGQFLVLIDGHPQYQGIFGHSIADSYQTMIAERVEVMRGPASILYGSNAMGGVINIVTRQQQKDGIRTSLNLGGGSYGTAISEASVQVKKGKFSSIVAAQYNRSDNQRPDMGFEQFGGFVKLGYRINEHWNSSANLDITKFNASNPGSILSPMNENDQHIRRGSANLVIENQYKHTSGAISIYDNFGKHEINDGYANGAKPQTEFFNSRDAVAGLSWYQSASLYKGNNITAGIDYQHIYGRAWYSDRETGVTVTSGKRKMQSTHAHENEVAAYVDFRQDITGILTLDLGIRYDHHSTAGGEWVPQAGAVVRPIESGELKAMVSKGFRNPTNKEMYLYGTANHETLEAESMMNYELSWKHRLLTNRLTYGVNVFYIDGDNMIQTVGGKNINSGEFKNCGAEVELSYHINKHWNLTTNHSYLHMETPIVAAPTYKGFIGTDCNYGKWNVSAGLQQVGALYTAAGNTPSRENFTLLNVTVGYNPTSYLHLWVKGDNLLGQKYEIIAGYPMPKATFMAGVRFSI